MNVGISATLTGGACVAIWSEGKYHSRDLDFIEEGPVSRRKVRDVLTTIGFTEKDRHFVHPETEYYVEFPAGPLTVGDERVYEVEIRSTGAGYLRLLTPTDCVKDRLAAFFYWNDMMAFEQALLVARAQPVDVGDLRRWASMEGEVEKLATFEKALDRD